MNRPFSQINKIRMVILCLLVCMTGACAETPVNKHGSVLKQPPSGAPGVSGKPSRKEGHLRSEFRRCISNPAAGTGYASWGSYGAEWMKGIAEAFVTDFNAGNNPKHTVQLKFDDNSKEIADFYRDATLVTNGKDHSVSESGHGGIDEGVFYFHVGHGDPDGFDIRVGNELVMEDGTVARHGSGSIRIGPREMLLGNCSCDSDGCKSGQLRYLWLCSCRVFAHGPRISATEASLQKNRDEYDRPSDFKGSSRDTEEHRNVVKRWGPVLSENMRMACGASTRATCSERVVASLRKNYFDDGMGVADSWGHALAKYHKGQLIDPSSGNLIRTVHVTPLCIARGNANAADLKSPITDDQYVTNKANPYDKAFHVVSWEHDSAHTLMRKEQTPPAALPVLVTTTPKWLAEGKRIKDLLPPEESYRQGDMLISKKTTLDGRPRVKVDARMGAVIIARDRKPLSADVNNPALSVKTYAGAARKFIEEQSWTESDMDTMEAVRGMLQVIPADPRCDSASILKVQKDITFYIGRRIPLETGSAKVFGFDNMMVVQMNNDGTVKGASKRWRQITGKIKDVPLKSYEDAYTEALKQLNKPGLYEISTWDWGYKSTPDDSGQGRMLIYYNFTFEPVASIEGCISESITIEIQGHVL